MPPLIDLTGKKFGRLTVIGRAPTVRNRTYWLCECDCGKRISVDGGNLRGGHTESCGCLQKERASQANTTHGMRGTRLYRIWNCMRNRCYRKSYHAYKHYGGRGIRVCPEWNSFEPFRDWAMSYGYKDDLSIDRIDVNGNYSPENCRWVTMAYQNQNKRAKNGYKIKEDNNG